MINPLTETLFKLIAADGNNLAAIKVLVEHSKVYAQTPLLAHLAIQYDAVYKYENVEHNLLTLASRLGKLDVVGLLLAEGVDVNSKTGGKLPQPALWLAAKSNHAEVVKRLISTGAEVDADALEEKVERVHVDPLNGIVTDGPLFTDIGQTKKSFPLTVAASYLHYDVLLLLLASNANTEIRNTINNKNDLSAVDIISKNGSLEQRQKCLNLFAAAKNLKISIANVNDNLACKKYLMAALETDVSFVITYLTHIAETVNLKQWGEKINTVYDSPKFLKLALKELKRFKKDSPTSIEANKEIYQNFLQHLIPMACGDNWVFANEDEKMKLLTSLGAYAEFGTTFGSFAQVPAVAVAKSFRFLAAGNASVVVQQAEQAPEPQAIQAISVVPPAEPTSLPRPKGP